MIRTRQQSARRPNLESLEDRRLLSQFTVENTNSFGTGSLAQAIVSANANDQANTITFDPTVFGTPQTITVLGSPLARSPIPRASDDHGPGGGRDDQRRGH